MRYVFASIALVSFVAPGSPLFAFTGSNHIRITRHACASSGAELSKQDLDYILYYNVLQDENPECWNDMFRHFCNHFSEGARYLDREWQTVSQTRDRLTALRAFGRITHTVEDFYAHTNWVELHLGEKVIPTFPFDTSHMPPKLICAWWPDDAPEVTRNGVINHEMLNKDASDSHAGKKIVSSGPNKGRSVFELAFDVARRSCEEQFRRFGRILAANKIQNTKLYIFSHSNFYRYDLFAGQMDPGYPRPIAGNWKGMTFSSVEAAVNWGNGKVYFFKRGEYIKYDVKADCADAGYPKPIAANWPGMSFPKIDAVFVYERLNCAYFFHRGQYIRFDLKADKAEAGYPKSVPDSWKGLSSDSWSSALNWENGLVDFFKGAHSVRYDLAGDKVVSTGKPIDAYRSDWPKQINAVLIWY